MAPFAGFELGFSFFVVGFFGSVDVRVRETCFGPCVVATAYAAVIESARRKTLAWWLSG